MLQEPVTGQLSPGYTERDKFKLPCARSFVTCAGVAKHVREKKKRERETENKKSQEQRFNYLM